MDDFYERMFGEKELYQAFRNLRDTYRCKVKDAREKSRNLSGAEASQNIEARLQNWPFYEPMSFLSSVNDQGIRYTTTSEATREEGDADLVESLPSQCSSRASSRPRTPHTLDDIANAIRQHEQTDHYEITGMNIAGKLRQLCEMGAKVGEKLVLKADELAVDLTKATIKVQNGEVVE
ncbi:unnamed protein product [Nippostrongylus brasiliensis]|uniref:MADF domain-containing protein n=1 Tax=Nippostrongylus brasiliensis TaxID=27835 RepID=A0A0N4Y0B3_NIPBR|nr:unnamed protein product [Nippostrongylus brasiliensis]